MLESERQSGKLPYDPGECGGKDGPAGAPTRAGLGWIGLLCVIAVTAMIRWRLLPAPLERDEGEYAYGAQLLLSGDLPYEQIHSLKLPGIFAAYAGIIAVIGETPEAIRIGLLVANAVATLLIFLIGSRLANHRIGLAAALSFATLSLGQALQGVFANAEHFVLPWLLLGLLLLLKSPGPGSRPLPGAAGLAMGLALLTKQHSAPFIALGALYLWLEQADDESQGVSSERLRKISIFLVGTSAPLLVTALFFWQRGALADLWFWTVQYAWIYAAEVGAEAPMARLADSTSRIFADSHSLWCLAALGLAISVFRPSPRRQRLLLCLLSIFSILAICPGFYFRPHYFVLLLPTASLLAATGADGLGEIFGPRLGSRARRSIPVLVVALCAAATLYGQRVFLFQLEPKQVTRSSFNANAFPEALRIAEYLRENTSADDTIAVLGSEPQLFFYSQRRSATPYVYMYPLMEGHSFALQMQEEMIADIEAARPKLLVYYALPHSWMRQEDSHTRIMEWFEGFQEAHYGLVGMVELHPQRSSFQWFPKLSWPPRTESYILILKRDET